MKEIYIDAHNPILDCTDGFRSLNMERIWKEILPFTQSLESRLLHNTCYKGWIPFDIDDYDFYDEDDQLMAWKLAYEYDTDYSYLEYKIRKLAKRDKEAQHAWGSYRNSIDVEDDDLRMEIKSHFWDYARSFIPKKESPEFWAASHSCHHIAPWVFSLAIKWRPDLKWNIIEGDAHTTIACLSEKIVLDILNYRQLSGPAVLRFTRKEVY